MPTRDKTTLRPEEVDRPAEVETLLGQMEDEEVPERLLTLAMELQQALNRRREASAGGTEDPDNLPYSSVEGGH